MINVEHIEDWRGKTVLDAAGESLGKLQEVFFDKGSGTPILVSIRSGLLGRRAKLIPIDGAGVGPDYVRVAYDRDAVDGSPDASHEEPPDAAGLDAIGEAYGLRFSERVSLQTATALEELRARARAARDRAEELESQARELAAEREAAHDRAQGAHADAGQADHDAERARKAAEEARRAAAEFDDVELDR